MVSKLTPSTPMLLANLLVIGFVVILGSNLTNASTPKAQQLSDADLLCGVANIYHEGRGESTMGQIAIAKIVMNRLRSGRHGKSICEVVWEPNQFSWTNDNIPNTMTDVQAIKKSVDIFLKVYYGKTQNPVKDYLNYHAFNEVNPSYARNVKDYIIIGNHKFYTAR